MMKINQHTVLGTALLQNKFVKILEIIVVFASALVLAIGTIFTGDDPIIRQSVAWLANVVMLFLVWLGLKLRGQSWKDIGLSLKFINLKTFLLSLLVFAAALIAFIIGSIIMVNITGMPQASDMSGYNYIKENWLVLIGVLISVYFVSSFGEEVIYRGFLINRISDIGGNSKNWIRAAVLISSIIFGLIHYEWGLMGIVQTGFMGLALGICFIIFKRNLWILVLAHAYLDTILMVQLYLGGIN